MSLNMKPKYFAVISMITLFTISSLIGFHCSRGFKGTIEERLTLDHQSTSDPDFNSMVDLPIGLMTPVEIFNSMKQATQIPNAEQSTINEFFSKQGTFPTEGQLYKVNSPMLLSATNLSSYFCQQMINIEKVQSPDTRTFTNEINYGDTPKNMKTGQLNSVLRRLARSAWGRNETSSESEIIKSGMTEMISELSDSEKSNVAFTEKMILVLCSAVISSIDTVSL